MRVLPRRGASAAALPVFACVALALALGLAACSHDGRTLRPPAPGAVISQASSTTVQPSTSDAVGNPPVGSSDGDALRLTSDAFGDGEDIPTRYTCQGANVSPPLDWSGVPADTVDLAITMVDPDAPGGFIHWVITNIDPTATGLDEGEFPEGAVDARNDTSEFGWFGPCPPEGQPHHYVFTLYALRSPLGLEQGTGGVDAIARLAATPGISTNLTGLFAS